MARRIGGGGGLAAFLANESRNDREDSGVNPFAMAMQLLGMQTERRERAEDLAFKERGAEAERLWREGQLDIGRRSEAREEKEAEDRLTREKTEDIQKQMDRAEDVAFRGRQEQTAAEKEAAERTRKEQEQRQALFEKALDKDLIKPGTPEYDEWIKDLDPGFVERTGRIEGLQKEKLYGEKLKKYRELTPKVREKIGKTPASIEEFGGPEIYKRILEAERQTTPVETAPPAPTLPSQQQRFGNYGTTAQQEAPAYSYVTRNPQAIPAVGGITEPVAVPQEAAFAYEEGYPSAQPDYMYGIQTPIPADVINRVEADPRYMTAEQELLMKLRNWWGGNQEPVSALNVGEYAPGAGFPRQMRAAEPVAQPESGFMDAVLARLEEARNAEPRKWGHGKWTPPIGRGLPPPRPTQLLGEQKPGGLFYR
jgi:hypothetical protein